MARLRLRIGNEYDGDPETKEFRDATFAEAVAALQGDHSENFHRDMSVYVVNTHVEDHTVEGDGRSRRTVSYVQGEPIFGEKATIYSRRVSFAEIMKDAQVSWASGGSSDVEDARVMISIYTLACALAEAANAEPACPQCLEAIEHYKARFADKS